MKYIIAFYNKITNEPICYIINRYKITSDVKKCFEYDSELGLNTFAKEIHGQLHNVLNDIYNGNDSGNMTEHEYYHIKEDYFKNIKKKNIRFVITTKDNEIVYMRKLKLKKLYEKLRNS